MKYLLLLICINFFTHSIYSQFLHSSLKGEKRYIYSDIADVRKSPNIDSEITDKIKAGHEVNIEDVVVVGIIENTEGFWVQVTYKNKGEDKEGFLWSNNLSQTQMRRGDTKFVYGLESINKEELEAIGDAIFGIKAIKNDNIICQKKLSVSTSSLSISEGQIRSNGGLSKTEYIVKISFSGAACGLGTYGFNYAWNGKNLIELPRTIDVGDGMYTHIEYLIYPESNNLPEDHILKVITEGETLDENAPMDLDYKVILYKWDGTQVIPLKIN